MSGDWRDGTKMGTKCWGGVNDCDTSNGSCYGLLGSFQNNTIHAAKEPRADNLPNVVYRDATRLALDHTRCQARRHTIAHSTE